jgi:hypothetical protein
MRHIITAVVCSCAVALTAAGQVRDREAWEIGVAAGYGFSRDVKIESATAQASGGLRPGFAFGVVAGNHVRSWLSGEARYTYRQNDLRLSGGGAEARFDAESHVLHYDFLFSAGKRGSIQPFLAAGAGIRYFRGTGRESSSQALSRVAILTRTDDLRPLISLGAGIRIPLSSLLSLRVEARDYLSPFPTEVIAPVPGARTSGWLHDFVPMVGLSFTF